MNILIVVPSFKILGGVANHYKGLDPYWTNNICYSFQGKREKIHAIFTFIPDLFLFVFRLLFKKIDIVIINPSLRKYQLARDSIFLLLAKLLNKKIITFFHGWDQTVADAIITHPFLFKYIYGKSTFIYCLCTEFRENLIKMGIESPILLTTTKVSDNLVANFNIDRRNGTIKTILFLARLEISKGIFITLQTFYELKKRYPNLKLLICGSGGSERSAREYVIINNISDVYFCGNVSGQVLIDTFIESDIYILPTYSEGMATSILEAMAFGLPIVSRSVGGIKDFFQQGKMGYLTESLDSSDYVQIIESLINNPDLVREISLNNHSYAIKHFLASKVAASIEQDIHHFCR